MMRKLSSLNSNVDKKKKKLNKKSTQNFKVDNNTRRGNREKILLHKRQLS